MSIHCLRSCMAVRSIQSLGRIFSPSYNFMSIHCLRSCIAVEQIRFLSRLSRPSEVEINFNFRLWIGFSGLLILWRLVLISFWCKMRKTIGGIINLVSVHQHYHLKHYHHYHRHLKISPTFSTGQAPRIPEILHAKTFHHGLIKVLKITSL